MSLNTASVNGGVLIHQGEMILLHAKSVQLSFSGSYDLKFGEKTGNAYLTTHRLIFIKEGKNNGPSADFQSFSFPFVTLTEVDVEQPVFGANYLKGKVRAQPNGNWMGEAKFKLVFKHGGAIDFASGMLKAIHLTQVLNRLPAGWDTAPPPYSEVIGGGYHAAPPNYYATPSNYNGWNAPNYNFPPPDAGTVYIAEAPPPYPGIGFQPFIQQQQNQQNMNGGYPPQGYPQQGQGYPQQGQGYPPQQGFGYPQQGPGYPAPGYPNPPMSNGGFGVPAYGPTTNFNPPPYEATPGSYAAPPPQSGSDGQAPPPPENPYFKKQN